VQLRDIMFFIKETRTQHDGQTHEALTTATDTTTTNTQETKNSSILWMVMTLVYIYIYIYVSLFFLQEIKRNSQV